MAAPDKGTVAALSLSAVGMVALSVVMLLLDTELDYRPLQSQRQLQAVAVPLARAMPSPDSSGDARMAEITLRFQQAVMMLHAGRYEHAATALHRVLALSPRLTAAHVNMGYAMLGLRRLREAESFFRTAIDLDPYQGNAYWGLAEVFEQRGDLPAALGAMRTYIHLAPAGDPYVRRARSALWEWDTRLARGPQSEEERHSLAEKQRRWAARNSPRRDAPAADLGREIIVQPIE